MGRRVLIVATVVLLGVTVWMVWSGARLEDGSMVDLSQCWHDRDYYGRHEKPCDQLEFYIPLFTGPVWVILILLWFGYIFHGLNRRNKKQP